MKSSRLHSDNSDEEPVKVCLRIVGLLSFICKGFVRVSLFVLVSCRLGLRGGVADGMGRLPCDDRETARVIEGIVGTGCST